MNISTEGEALFESVVADRLLLATATAAIVIVAYVLQGLLKTDPLANFPIIGKGGRAARRKAFVGGKGRDLYIEGYRKFKDGIFRITTARKSESVVISPSFLPELKKLPDDVLSFSAAVSESMHTQHTKVQTDIASIPYTVKTSLTPALVRLNPIVADEVVESMRIELPQSPSWSEVKINDKLLRIVAMASGRIFIGPELCRDEAYLDAAINYTIDLMTAVHIISFMPVWLRPFLAPFIPQIKKLKQRIDEADAFLRPIVSARREAAKNPDYQKPDDMLQWLIDSQGKFGVKDDKELANNQLGISFAAIHTTTLTALNSLYTLAANPELAPILREDVYQALQETDGQYTSLALQNMKKLDSFLKETLRYYPLSASSFQRKVLKSFVLSNGQRIPAGVVIEIPAIGVAGDPELFEDPGVFDALRFYKMRQAKDQETTGIKAAEAVANSQFVSVGSSSLTFGYGRHACPGRFFAANEIKMIMAQFLQYYDIKLPDGVTERHPNKEIGGQSIPDGSKTLMIRKI